MARRYHCPQCANNQTQFYLIKKLAQEVRKDAVSGKVAWASDEWEEVFDGATIFLEVKCANCGYTAPEKRFTQ